MNLLYVTALLTAIGALLTRPLAAQPLLSKPPSIVVGDGWEGFPNVEYVGGEAASPKKLKGMLILTDTTLAFYKCFYDVCQTDGSRYYVEKDRYWIRPLRSLTAVSSSSQNRGPSITGRVIFGVLATDNNEEYFGFTYESEMTADSPVFKTPRATSAALEAKVRFRLKKLGVSLPQ